MLVTSIISFSHNVFYPLHNKFQFFHHNYFVVCKCFQFGPDQKFVFCGKELIKHFEIQIEAIIFLFHFSGARFMLERSWQCGHKRLDVLYSVGLIYAAKVKPELAL